MAQIRYEIWDDNNLRNAIPGATPRARIVLTRLGLGLPLISRPGGRLSVSARVSNLSRRAFPAHASFGRRLVRLGAQLCTSDGKVTDRDRARARLPRTLAPGASIDVAIDVPIPTTAGRYALKFDLVSEGINWFEACGSETMTAPLWVVA